MTSPLKPYPSYKTTRLAWLPSLPTHWEVLRIKDVLREFERRTATGEGRLLSLRMREGLIDHLAAGGKPVPAEVLVGYKLTEPGIVVMNRMRAAAGLFGLADSEGLVSPDYATFRIIRDCDPSYLLYLFKSPLLVQVFRAESKGLGTGESGFLRLYTDRFGAVHIPLPPRTEQAAIVRLLDFMTQLVRRYVSAKLRIVNLLREQKRSLVQQAVTQGLEADVRKQPSCVEWLGSVPASWQERRLKTVLRKIDQGVSPQAENYLADDAESWGVLKAGCVNHGFFKETEHKRLPAGFVVDPSLRVQQGDVLVSRASGSPQLVGSVARVQSLSYRVILSDKTFRLEFNDLVDPDFMVFAMNSLSYRQQVERAISGAEGLANNLPLSSLRTFIFPIPPLPEQQTIVRFLREATSKVDAAIEQLGREIGLIREFQSRLVTDVLMGHFDVREAAARLPDEPDGEVLSLPGEILEEADEADPELDDLVEEVAE